MDEETPDPQKIGQVFVMQYYMQMHKDPSQMHRFYLSDSVFSRGGPEMGTVTPVVGQQAIHEKTQSLGLQKVYTRIRQVDSHLTISNSIGESIVVQVTGELSSAGQTMRPFVQTFILALESPKKYYVRNDIFRYQIYDEDFVSEADDANEAQVEIEPAVNVNSVEPAPLVDHTHPEEGGEDVVSDSSLKSSPVPAAPEAPPTTNNWSDHYEGTMELANGVPEGTEETAVTPTNTGFSHPPTETEEAVAVNDERDNKATKDMSWASKLKSAGSGPSKPQSGSNPVPPPSSKLSSSLQSRGPGAMVNSTQPLPQREPKQSRIKQQDPTKPMDKKPALTAPASFSASPSVPLTRSAPDSHQVFVGNLPNGTKEEELKEIFKKFGNVIEVRINPKNFGFIVFDSEDPVQHIIATRSETNLTLHDRKLNIEEKRPSAFQKTMGGSGGGGFGSSRKFAPSSGGMFSSGGNKYLGGRASGVNAAGKPPPRR